MNGRRVVPDNWEQIVDHVYRCGELHTLKDLMREWLRRTETNAWADGYAKAFDIAETVGTKEIEGGDES